MTEVDSLLLDAKQAILDEQHRRFETLQREGRGADALRQFHVTMHCAADLLNESLRLLDSTLKKHGQQPESAESPDSSK